MPTNRTVPTPIVNKNGVSTTVHKRVDNNALSSALAIPAPVIGTGEADRSASLGMTLEEVDRHPGDIARMFAQAVRRSGSNRRSGSSMSHDVMTKMIQSLHPETLSRLEKYSQKTMGSAQRYIASALRGRNCHLMNNIGLLADESIDYATMCYHVAGLTYRFAPTEKKDYSWASESEVESARAVLSVSTRIGQEYLTDSTVQSTPAIYIRSSRLVKLIESRPQDADTIVTLLNERKLPVSTDEDIEVMVMLLDDDGARSLREGAL